MKKKSRKRKNGLIGLDERIRALGGKILELDDFRPDSAWPVVVFKHEKDFLHLIEPKTIIFMLDGWFFTVGSDWVVYSIAERIK